MPFFSTINFNFNFSTFEVATIFVQRRISFKYPMQISALSIRVFNRVIFFFQLKRNTKILHGYQIKNSLIDNIAINDGEDGNRSLLIN